MITRRKRLPLWMRRETEEKLIHIHDQWLHMRLHPFYRGGPYCENVFEIETDIFIVALSEGHVEPTRYLQLCDGTQLIQRYTISEEEYWQLNPIPF